MWEKFMADDSLHDYFVVSRMSKKKFKQPVYKPRLFT